MIRLKNKEDIAGIKVSGKILASAMDMLTKEIKAGTNGINLNKLADEFIRDNKGTPSFLKAGFPTALCVSVNDVVIHGLPNNISFKEGDIVGLDLGVLFNNYYSDMAKTFAIGSVDAKITTLLNDTEKSLFLAIEAINKKDARLNDIGKAITEFLSPKKYGIVYDFCGHGVGFEVHEDPQISHFYPSGGPNPRLKTGMVLAIEPMITLGTAEVFIDKKDKWSVHTADGSLSAHFEHTIAITDSGIEILTKFD